MTFEVEETPLVTTTFVTGERTKEKDRHKQVFACFKCQIWKATNVVTSYIIF